MKIFAVGAVEIQIHVAVFLLREPSRQQLRHRVLPGDDEQLHAGKIERGVEHVRRIRVLGGDAIQLAGVERGGELFGERRRLGILREGGCGQHTREGGSQRNMGDARGQLQDSPPGIVDGL